MPASIFSPNNPQPASAAGGLTVPGQPQAQLGPDGQLVITAQPPQQQGNPLLEGLIAGAVGGAIGSKPPTTGSILGSAVEAIKPPTVPVSTPQFDISSILPGAGSAIPETSFGEVVGSGALPDGGAGLLTESGMVIPEAGIGPTPLAVPAAVAASALLTGDTTLDAFKGEASNKQLGATFAANPIMGQFLAPLNAAGKFFGSGKSGMERDRDAGRNFLRANTGIYAGKTKSDQEAIINLADGRTWDHRSMDNSWQVDLEEVHSDPQKVDILGTLAAINVAMFGVEEDPDIFSEMAAEQYHAATRGEGDSVENTKAIVNNSGLDWGNAKHAIRLRWEAGEIEAPERDAYFAAIDKHYGVENPNDVRFEDVAGLSDELQARNDEELGAGG